MGRVVSKYRGALTGADLFAANVVCAAGVPVLLGREIVPAGTAHSLGFGDLKGQDNAEGRIYIDIKDDTNPAADENGLIRFELWDPQGHTVQVLFEARTETLRTSATDRTQQLALPRIPVTWGEDWSLALVFVPDAADTIVAASSVVLVDITVGVVR